MRFEEDDGGNMQIKNKNICRFELCNGVRKSTRGKHSLYLVEVFIYMVGFKYFTILLPVWEIDNGGLWAVLLTHYLLHYLITCY